VEFAAVAAKELPSLDEELKRRNLAPVGSAKPAGKP
jgi:hypothetical protein